MSILKMTDLDLSQKKVLIREDFNVPINEKGEITSFARIEAAIPTIENALKKGAKIILMAHLGRPEEGHFDEQFSLKPVAEALSKILKHPVRLQTDWLTGVSFKENEIVLCENVRFEKGEEQNELSLSQRMAALCDVFVMDAFAVAHRKQASTYGVAQYAPIACAGPLLVSELEALGRAIEFPEHPVVAIVAGSKVSTKLKLLRNLAKLADVVIVGGGIANTFLAANNCPVGLSLCETDLISEAKKLLAFPNAKEKFPLPIDVVVAKEFSKNAKAEIKSIFEVQSNEMILDIGPQTRNLFKDIIDKAATIIWNGPVGVFEFDAFGEGTKALAKAIAKSAAFSIAGGGDTIAAIEKYGISDEISYLSTGGGAFLECLQGETLPAVAILEERDSK